jgi:hypothetical protein
MSRISLFLAEERRRKVISAGILYMAVAFALIEGADLVAPRLQTPDWKVTALVVFALVDLWLAKRLSTPSLFLRNNFSLEPYTLLTSTILPCGNT